MSDSVPAGSQTAEALWPAAGLARSALEDANQTDLVLRVCGSSNDGKLIRLRSTKCSIGSSPQCTLRLRCSRFRPVHCLILRGPNATVVRSWTPETFVNGRRFIDAMLAPGDRLGVGPIELEVVELGRVITQQAASAEWPQQAWPSAAQQQVAPAEHRKPAAAEDQTSGFQPSPSDDKIGHTAHPPERQQIAADAAQLQHRPDTPQSSANTLLQRRAEALRVARQRNRHLLKLLRRLKAQLADATTVRPAADLAIEAPEPQFGPNSGVQRDAYYREPQSPGGLPQYSASENDVESLAGENDVEKGFASQASDAPIRGPVTPEHSERPEDQPTRQPKAGAPVDLAEVFRRIGIAGNLLDIAEEETSDGSSSASTTPPSTERRPGAGSPGTHSEHDPAEAEDAIDTYMQQLLQRLRGGQAESHSPRPRKSRRAGSSRAADVSAPTGVRPEPSPSVGPQDDSSTAAELPPSPAAAEATTRVLPPEKLTGLSAMREVANISAQTALSQHARRMLARTRRFKLLASMTSVFCGIALLWLWGWYGRPLATMLVGLLSLTAGLVWAIQYAVLTGRLVLHRRGQAKVCEETADACAGAETQTPRRLPSDKAQPQSADGFGHQRPPAASETSAQHTHTPGGG